MEALKVQDAKVIELDKTEEELLEEFGVLSWAEYNFAVLR